MRKRTLIGWSLALLTPLLLWWGVTWARAEAERRIIDALQQRASHLGWTLEVGHAHIDWVGRVTVQDLRATGPLGGHITVRSLRATLPPSRWWSGPYRPDFVLIDGLSGTTSLDEIDHTRAHLRQRAEPSAAGPSTEALTLHINHLDISLAGLDRFGAHLPSRLTAQSVVARRVARSWELSVSGDLEGIDATTLPFSAQARLSAEEGALDASVRFPKNQARVEGPQGSDCVLGGLLLTASAAHLSARPISLVCTHPRAGSLSLSHLRAKRAGDTWTLDLHKLKLSPSSRWEFVKTLSIEHLTATLHTPALTKPSSWHLLGPLRLQQPDAELDAAALLNGPIRRRAPRAARITRELMARFDIHLPPAPLHDARQPRPASPPASLPDLPPIKIEDARLTLRFDPTHTWQLTGIDFDANPTDQRHHYEVGFRAGGTSARLILDLPSAEAPKVHLDLRAVPLPDLFRIAGLPAPPLLSGHADLDLTFHQNPHGDWLLEGKTALRDGQFQHPKVSEQPIHNINLSAQGRLRYRPTADHLWLEDAQLSSGPLRLDVVAQVATLQTDPTLSFTLSNPYLPCDAIPAAIPDGALESIQHVVMRGQHASPTIQGFMRALDPMTFELEVTGFPGDCAIAALPPYDIAALNDPKYVHTTTYTSLPHGIRVGPGTPSFAPLASLPSFLRAAMFMTEDVRFFDHGGVRVGQFVRAVRLNLSKGRYVYGGSSLTQQLIKNLLLHRRKTLSRKLEEVLIAWHLEDLVSKDRILELYINCIEFGPDIYGITQAAAFYFDKTPQDLTPLEAAFLASLKVSPRVGGDFYEFGFPSEKRWWSKRVKEILLILARNGYISPAEVIASYPWTPTFVYPANTKDFRSQWLTRRRLARRAAATP